MRNWNFLLTVFFKKHRMRLWNIDWAWERRETRITSTSIIFFSFFSFIFFSFFSFMFFTLIILTFLSKHKILKIKEFQLKYLKFLKFKISQNFKFLHSNTLLDIQINIEWLVPLHYPMDAKYLHYFNRWLMFYPLFG